MKRVVYIAAFMAPMAMVLAQGPNAEQVAINTARSAADARAAALGGEIALVPIDVAVDSVGQAHVRYQETYRGIPVFEGEAIVHVDLQAQTVVDVTDALIAVDTIDTRPGLGAENANSRARDHFSVPPGLAERTDLVVLVEQGAAYLAWQVRTSGDDAGGPIDKVAFIDARGGGVLRSWDNLHTAEAGTGHGFFNGTVSLTTNSRSGGYELRDPSRGNQFTVDMKNKQNGAGAIFTDADNVWGDSTLSNRQTVGVDAQYGTAETWDYYVDVHKRNGIKNNGVGASNRVHYGRNYNNAFWSDSCFCMTYGDGDGRTFNPFDSLDVAGHEMSHGVTSATANLTYSREPGGLNEATSDIFGTMVEFYANNPNDPPDYLIGERLYKSGDRTLRSMIRPSSDGASADCWYPNVGSLNVHHSSGVGNHFFHLLAEGTSMGSLTCAAGDTRVASGAGALAGIGRQQAEKIWYAALTGYMTSSTTYAGARTATMTAAASLYGAGSAQAAAVAASWTAVHVN
jgi:Zn-dependent metalloprotease